MFTLPPLKYLSSFFSYKLRSLFAGTRIPKNHALRKQLINNIRIKNKNLAKELEIECRKKGYLTFYEFMTICQFGENGYYATHKNHGLTDSYLRWPKALLSLCKIHNLQTIIEFGFGDGALGIHTLKLAKKYAYPLSWIGIEKNNSSLKKAQKLFKKEKVENYIKALLASIKDISITKPSLLVFSYSLDSIIPDLFINTKNINSNLNTQIGIKIEKGILSECLIPYTLPPIPFNLSPFQTAFIPLDALRILKYLVKKLPKGSICVILDEFSTNSLSWENNTLNMPKDLEKFGPARNVSLTQLYKDAGKSLLYFPLSLNMTTNLLKNLDCRVEYDNEHLAAEKVCKLEELPKFPTKTSLCYAVVAKK